MGKMIQKIPKKTPQKHQKHIKNTIKNMQKHRKTRAKTPQNAYFRTSDSTFSAFRPPIPEFQSRIPVLAPKFDARKSENSEL
jgi:hypothetical protein